MFIPSVRPCFVYRLYRFLCPAFRFAALAIRDPNAWNDNCTNDRNASLHNSASSVLQLHIPSEPVNVELILNKETDSLSFGPPYVWLYIGWLSRQFRPLSVYRLRGSPVVCLKTPTRFRWGVYYSFTNYKL